MNEHSGYWGRQRISRRAALRSAGIGLAGVSAAALIGCSSSSKDPPAGAGATTPGGAVIIPGNAPAKKGAPESGGTLRIAVQADVDTFDVIAAPGGKTYANFGGYVYPRLFKFATGDGVPASGKLEGDLIAKWEHPDDLTYVLHVRQGMKWDKRAPTNGRQVNAEDVVASWKYFADKSFYKNDLVNALNKNAPIKDIKAINATTVEMKLAVPDAAVLAISATWSDLWVMPAEAYNGGFDPAKESRGAGPFLLTKHQPSVGFTFDRNPDYYDAPRPYVDRIEQSIIADVAQLEAQFAAKKLHFGMQQDSVIELQKRLPGTRVDVLEPSAAGGNIGLGLRTGSPFLDVRVRRAMNMLLDRNTIIDVISEPKKVEALGAKMGRYWNTPVPAGYGAFYLNPNGKDFGAAAQYLKFNPGEAKKLLDAASFPYTKIFPLTYTTNSYGREWPRLAEIVQSMLQAGGIKTALNGVDYATGWIPNYLRIKGDFEGIGLWPNGARGDVGQWLQTFFSSGGANNQVGKAYPELDTMITAQQQITDFDKRVLAVHDIQRHMIENSIAVPFVGIGGTEVIDISWQGLGNRHLTTWPGGVLQSERTPLYWLDKDLRG